jgi:hypothetical protein
MIEESGTPFNEWLYIIKHLLVSENGFTKEQAECIDTTNLKFWYEDDYTPELVIKCLFPNT